MNILITGATGFIGSYVARNLANHSDCNVTVIHRESSKTDLLAEAKEKVKFVLADVTDVPSLQVAFNNIDVVIHCAGLVSMDKRKARQMELINEIGTANVVNMCLDKGVSKLIHLSSVTALGGPRKSMIDEQSAWPENEMDSTYGFTKYKADLQVERGTYEGLNTTIIYPPYVLGAGFWSHGPNEMFNRVYAGLNFYPTGSGGVIDVRDLAQIISQFATQDQGTNNRLITSAQNMSHYDLMCLIGAGLNKPKPMKPVSNSIAQIGIFVENIKALLSKKERLVTTQSIFIANNDFKYDNSHSMENYGIRYRSVANTVTDVCQVYLDSVGKGMCFGILHID